MGVKAKFLSYWMHHKIWITHMQFKDYYSLTFIILFSLIINDSTAQQVPDKQDTFFLAKKKGLLGKLGRSISIGTPDIKPQKVENQFLKFKGKFIRYIDIVRLGFENNIYDTNLVQNNFGISVAKRFHRNSGEKTISHNLFFKEGDRVYPYLLADNERYLRELVYIQDARILMEYTETGTDSVDVVVLTKDVFSIGGKLVISNKKKGRAELKEENFKGTGTRVSVGGFYEDGRHPVKGFSAEVVKRNIGGSFIDWTTGMKSYREAFSSGRNEETSFYTSLDKPLVTPYIPTTGSVDAAFYKTTNAYVSDSLYRKYYRYNYYNLDAWFGYSLDSKRLLYANKEIKKHRFIAIRGFNQQFLQTPDTAKIAFDYRFSNFTGTLASLNIFRQIFYKTNFIYGFGRSEDIPEGFSAAFTLGYVNKRSIKRPYSGIDAQYANYNSKGSYNNYTFRLGGYYFKNRFEDVNMLFNVEHFSRLAKLSASWFQRFFITSGITAQVNPKLNQPLFLNNDFGLPYFDNGAISADLRATVKTESVFYNTKKTLGFRMAPFIFGDFSLLKPSKFGLGKSDIFSAVGGGVRTRNENLIFGTIELKGYYFPRTNGDMHPWKVELNSNIRFKYRSSFINRPDFIIAN